MSAALLKVVVALAPALVLLTGSALLLLRTRAVSSWLQLFGTIGLTVVVLTHVCEMFQLLPWMRWGAPDSIGHYFDLASAVLGLALFPTGYLWHELKGRQVGMD
jgi:hypothetical protein